MKPIPDVPAPPAAHPESTAPALSPRELQVLGLLVEGTTNKQVGLALNISIKTVEKHRQNLMNKLNIHHITGLTRYAIAAGLSEIPSPITFD